MSRKDILISLAIAVVWAVIGGLVVFLPSMKDAPAWGNVIGYIVFIGGVIGLLALIGYIARRAILSKRAASQPDENSTA